VPDLSFRVTAAKAVPFAAAPLLALKLQVTNAVAVEAVHSVALRCQVQIDAKRRRYDGQDQARLFELFGEPERWGQTLRGLLWAHTNMNVPGFTGETVVDLPLPCSFDFNAAVTKYFHALEDGEVPLCLLFSGTVFYEANDGGLQVAQIPWEKEATYRLPVRVWKEMMEHYYPNSAWLCLRRDVFDGLYRYKIRHGLPTWEMVLESLLPPDQGGTP
jgi:hypothetical protein